MRSHTLKIIAAGVPPGDVLGSSATRMLFRVMTAAVPVTLRELCVSSGCRPQSKRYAFVIVKKMTAMGLVKQIPKSQNYHRGGFGFGVIPVGMFKLELVRGSKS